MLILTELRIRSVMNNCKNQKAEYLASCAIHSLTTKAHSKARGGDKISWYY